MSLEPYGDFWTFENCTYSIIPVGSIVWPVFLRKGFSSPTIKEKLYCEKPTFTTVVWYLAESDMFKVTDYIFDTATANLLGRRLSETESLLDLAFCRLPSMVENNLQGRTIIGFVFKTTDLRLYTPS